LEAEKGGLCLWAPRRRKKEGPRAKGGRQLLLVEEREEVGAIRPSGNVSGKGKKGRSRVDISLIKKRERLTEEYYPTFWKERGGQAQSRLDVLSSLDEGKKRAQIAEALLRIGFRGEGGRRGKGRETSGHASYYLSSATGKKKEGL